MNFHDIIESNPVLSSMPYIYVVTTLIEAEKIGLLKELNNDTDGNFEAPAY